MPSGGVPPWRPGIARARGPRALPAIRRRIAADLGLPDLPRSELFQYIDEAGERHCIDSADVNDYLREISGRDITAKDFRTWAATNLALLALADKERGRPTKKAQVEAVKEVAKRLGNTPAICRKCYIHPAVLEGYLDGSLRRTLAAIGQEEQLRRCGGSSGSPCDSSPRSNRLEALHAEALHEDG